MWYNKIVSLVFDKKFIKILQMQSERKIKKMNSHTKRTDRIGIIIKMLTDNPCKMLSLSSFSELFSVAKSSVSEDIVHIKSLFREYNIGEIDTVVGAGGGVRFIPTVSKEESKLFLDGLCIELSKEDRLMTGGFLYYVDLLLMPDIAKKLGYMLAGSFMSLQPDAVLTMETMGIPIALMTAQALGCPLVTARKQPKLTEGPIITISYTSESGKKLESMSIVKHSIKKDQRVIIIDDFMRSGGTIKGMRRLLEEMEAVHVGTGILISSAVPEHKVITDYVSLLTLDGVDEQTKTIHIRTTE